MDGQQFEAMPTTVAFRDLMIRMVRRVSDMPEEIVRKIVGELRGMLFEYQVRLEAAFDAR
jgi:hypothetical protein